MDSALDTIRLLFAVVLGVYVNTGFLASVLSITLLTVVIPTLAGWGDVVGDRNL